MLEISSELKKAYQESLFTIDGSDTINLKTHSKDCIKFLDNNNAISAVIITAYNPYSQAECDTINEISNMNLKSDLLDNGYKAIASINTGKDGCWLEKSWMVLDLEQPEIQKYLKKYKQNACLLITASGPELIYLDQI